MERPRQLWFKAALAFGGVVALLLLVQSVAGYHYVSRRLVREQLQRDADRIAVRLERSLRQVAGPLDWPRVQTTLAELAEEQQQRIAWLRVLDADGKVHAEAGPPESAPTSVKDLRRLFDEREIPGREVDTVRGSVYVAVVPVRVFVRPPDAPPPAADARPRGGPARVLEIALYEDAARANFGRLRLSLLINSIAALMLLTAMVLLARGLREYLRRRELDQQLTLARRIQSDLLPARVASVSGLECAAACIPAWQVGGDFYDLFELSGGRVGVLVGDVAGKGLGAALVMSMLHGAIRCSDWDEPRSHEAATRRLNSLLVDRTAPQIFASLFWGYFEGQTLHYVNAGHLPPLLVRDSGTGRARVERLTEGGPVLGVLPDAVYRQGSVRIEPGDLLVLYSDGVLEAANKADEEFGEARLEGIVSERRDDPCDVLCDDIVNRVRGFAHNGQLQDDLTLVLVRAPAASRLSAVA